MLFPLRIFVIVIFINHLLIDEKIALDFPLFRHFIKTYNVIKSFKIV